MSSPRNANAQENSGPRTGRFGGFKGDWNRLHKNIQAAQSTIVGDGDRDRYGVPAGKRWSELRWAVLKPSWVTSYDVVFYEYVESPEAAITGRWVLVQELTGQTDDLLFDQYGGGFVSCMITGIAGTPSGSEHMHVLWRGMNKQV
jgi:hypothetical protein